MCIKEKKGESRKERRGLENGALEWWEKMRQDQKNYREGMNGLWREEEHQEYMEP